MQLIRGDNKGAIAATVGLELLAILILMPATTPTILDANNRPLPGSIASLEKPVLLYLSSGPGQIALPFVRVLLKDNLSFF